MLPYTLGSERRDYFPKTPGSVGEAYMRISEDLRKIVVFLGFEDTKENIKCIGTGFLVFYKETGYLVTARHVAMALDDVPFMIRVNCKNGSSTNIFEDHIKWFCHPDDDVDIAIIPYDKLYNKSLYDVLYMPLPEWSKPISGEFIDIGDICYTIGLFRLLKGEKRNLPVVHSGNISLLPRDEKIPVSDWHEQQKTKYIEAYLVESQSLDGLSGAPVFARPTINYMLSPETDNDSLQKRRPSLGRPVYTSVGSENLYFLGIWHGSWNAPPDEITQVTMGISGAVRVSLGMGIVVPAKKLIELLEVPEVLKNRNNILARESSAYAASQDKVVIDNSQHKEDFISLVSEAAKKKKQDNKT